MTGPLADCPIIAFATIVDVERAKCFYRDTLGLTLLHESPPFALVFDANGVMVRLVMGKKLRRRMELCWGGGSRRLPVPVSSDDSAGDCITNSKHHKSRAGISSADDSASFPRKHDGRTAR